MAAEQAPDSLAALQSDAQVVVVVVGKSNQAPRERQQNTPARSIRVSYLNGGKKQAEAFQSGYVKFFAVCFR
jgi:hypothetical protein